MLRPPKLVTTVALALMGSLLAASTASAGWRGCGGWRCYSPCAAPAHVCQTTYETVERTIHVPETVMEQRTVQRTAYRPETRQRTVQVCRRVPETTMVTRTFTKVVPHQEMRPVQYRVCKPVYRTVDQPYVVRVPYQEVRQGTRTVCERYPVEVMRTVCRDAGYWENVDCQRLICCECRKLPRNCCCDSCHQHPVWVPHTVTEQVPVTVWQTRYVKKPYEYTCTVYKPETRVRQVRVCDYVYETASKDVPYMRYEHVSEQRQVPVTTYRTVTEEKVVNYTQMVPYTKDRVVNVPVCRMVPKVVTCRVPVPCHCGY